MHIGVVTLFPEMFDAISEYGVSSRALGGGANGSAANSIGASRDTVNGEGSANKTDAPENPLINLEFHNPRDFAIDKHGTVDDKPFGGGPGMLMRTEPLVAAIRQARASLMAGSAGRDKVSQDRKGQDTEAESDRPLTVYLSPQGTPLNHARVVELAQLPELVLVCGRYQGVDARVIEQEIDEEISLGDFVLSGGELAAMALIDAVVRLQPGALGDAESAAGDSLAAGLLHSPQYTRPREFEGSEVPQILLSGDHAAIRQWRRKQGLGATWLKRPDLLRKLTLDKEQTELLEQFKIEYHGNARRLGQ